MRADFIQMTAGGDRAIGVNHEVIADGGQIRVLPLPELVGALETALAVPAVNVVDRKVPAVGCGCTVDDDAFDLPGHAAIMAEDKGGNKVEGRPPGGFGRMGLTGYVGFRGLSNGQINE